MTLAHALGTNGPEIEFLILAAGMLVLALMFFFQKTVKPQIPLILVAGAFALTAGAFAFAPDEDGGPSGTATVIVEAPEEGATVPAEEPLKLRVVIEGGSLTQESSSSDPNAGHLHIYIDEDLVSMPSVATPEIPGEYLTVGEHEIVVEFTQANHRSYDPPIQTLLTVIAR